MTALPGTPIEFTCMYHSPEPLQIVVIQYGQPVYWPENMYNASEMGGKVSWHSIVGQNRSVVQCMVRKMDQIVVGLISARVYPGLLKIVQQLVHCCARDSWVMGRVSFRRFICVAFRQLAGGIKVLFYCCSSYYLLLTYCEVEKLNEFIITVQ